MSDGIDKNEIICPLTIVSISIESINSKKTRIINSMYINIVLIAKTRGLGETESKWTVAADLEVSRAKRLLSIKSH